MNAERYYRKTGLIAGVALFVSIFAIPKNADTAIGGENGVKHWPRDYRHIHKKKARAATAGNFAAIIPQCEKMLADYPQDGESLFFLGLAHAQKGNLKEAEKTVERAKAAGVPPQRFMAGPRSWTSAFYKKDAFADFRKKHGSGLLHGPMLGCITPTGAKFWVRTSEPKLVEIRVYSKTNDRAVTGKAKTSKSRDYTAVITVDGLEPDTEYAYNVAVEGNAQLAKPLPTFQTAPRDGEGTRLKIGFGGGAAYTPKFEHMWKTIAKHSPQSFFFLGDNVYIDDPNFREYQRYLYYRRQSQPDFRKLCQSSAIYAIWDDHDFGTNDCAGGPHLDKPKWKIPVWNVFRQNWNNPSYGGGEKQPGCWFDVVHGDIHFIFLDGRMYRTPRNKSGKDRPTMLGKAQLEWLLDTLKNSKSKIIVIISPVPWVGGNPDKWNGFPEEREIIFSHIEKHKIEGVMLMSADRHRSDVLVTRRKKGYDLYEFMSSRLTNVHTHGRAGPKDGAIFSYNKKCSFGLVEFDTTKADPTITYRIINIDNEEIHRFQLKRSQMTFGK